MVSSPVSKVSSAVSSTAIAAFTASSAVTTASTVSSTAVEASTVSSAATTASTVSSEPTTASTVYLAATAASTISSTAVEASTVSSAATTASTVSSEPTTASTVSSAPTTASIVSSAATTASTASSAATTASAASSSATTASRVSSAATTATVSSTATKTTVSSTVTICSSIKEPLYLGPVPSEEDIEMCTVLTAEESSILLTSLYRFYKSKISDLMKECITEDQKKVPNMTKRKDLLYEIIVEGSRFSRLTATLENVLEHTDLSSHKVAYTWLKKLYNEAMKLSLGHYSEVGNFSVKDYENYFVNI